MSRYDGAMRADVITAAFAYWVAGLDWIESLLIGAVPAPTDPVFAAALVGNDKVPARLRHLLNVESGVNDGLALPFVLIFLATASGDPSLHLGSLAGELIIGLAIGVIVPYLAIRLEATKYFSAAANYQPLNAFAIGLLVFALAPDAITAEPSDPHTVGRAADVGGRMVG